MSAPQVPVRSAHPDETGALALLWHAAWQDAHAALLPAALQRLRTLESFHARLLADFDLIRVTGAQGTPTGFCIARHDELDQLFVAAAARGTGCAAALLADGESRLARAGTRIAWLACAIGNTRAARFYEKHGWQRVGNTVIRLGTSEGKFPLEVWRYEKALGARDVR